MCVRACVRACVCVFLVIISHPRTVVDPCNSFYCLGHFKNVYDDDDDDDDDDVGRSRHRLRAARRAHVAAEPDDAVGRPLQLLVLVRARRSRPHARRTHAALRRRVSLRAPVRRRRRARSLPAGVRATDAQLLPAAQPAGRAARIVAVRRRCAWKFAAVRSRGSAARRRRIERWRCDAPRPAVSRRRYVREASDGVSRGLAVVHGGRINRSGRRQAREHGGQ